MVFSTPVFLFYFLAATLLIYYLVPRWGRNVVLLLSSLFFYYWGERSYTVIMLLSTVVDYTHGLLVERCKGRGNLKGAKLAVASSMVCNLGILFFFKYYDFMAGSLQAVGVDLLPVLGIHLPIGISFYTFQTMSYTIDVYRGDARAQRNILNFGTFVTLFPQLVAGPIIKYKDLGEQIDHRDYRVDRFAAGVEIFTIGLAKKLLLANNVGQLWDVYQATALTDLTVAGAWLGVLAYTFQIYFDFSGYSDMAIGLGRVFGFHFLENFNYPYVSRSVTEFWRRWHISLSTWFRDYLYIPLGGNRVSRGRQIRNLLIVWALTGFWHGAAWNFLFWGLYYALLLMGERYCWGRGWERMPAVLRHIGAMLLVMLGWLLFRASGTEQILLFLRAMVGAGEGGLWTNQVSYLLRQFWPELLAAPIACLPVAPWLRRKLSARGEGLGAGLLRYGAPGLALLFGGLSAMKLVEAGFNPFIYFQF